VNELRGIGIDTHEAALLARALRKLAVLTERQNGGGGLSAELMVMLGVLERHVRTTAGPRELATLSRGRAKQAPTSPGLVLEDQASRSVHDLDVGAAAAEIGCTPANVTDLARRRVLPGRKVGRFWRFHVEDVRDYKEGRAR
jgi:hypothetical protein